MPVPTLDPTTPPDETALRDALGRTHALWTALEAHLAERFGPLAVRWSYSKKGGLWSVRLESRPKRRAIVYLIVGPKRFQAAFALGEKACHAAHQSGLPTSVLDVIDQAPRYPEGRGVRLDVRTRKDLAHVEEIAAIKMAN